MAKTSGFFFIMNGKTSNFVFRMKSLYLFNPENDMALASGSPYYMSPASAKKMSADLSVLPAWYAGIDGAVLLADETQVQWMQKECRLPLNVEWVAEGRFANYTNFFPWGWSPALSKRLLDNGAESGLLPSEKQMSAVRELSSRKTAVNLLPLLKQEDTVGESFWLNSVEEVVNLSAKHDKVLLKSPWSGSGKGIQPLQGVPDDNLSGWIRRIISTQGGVVCEPYYNKVLDFAMEFYVADGSIGYVGYSLFETDSRGIYKGNCLASNEAIEKRLSVYVNPEILGRTRDKLMHELLGLADGVYQGYLGVDMMVVQKADAYALHPCVEVNWRMNMGVVSRLFFDRYMSPVSSGSYVIEYYPNKGDALNFHEEMKQKHPLLLQEGRLVEGYLSLTPVFFDTAYQIYVKAK